MMIESNHRTLMEIKRAAGSALNAIERFALNIIFSGIEGVAEHEWT